MDYHVIHKLKARETRRGVPSSELAVFDYLEHHFEQIPKMSVLAICEDSFTSQATINRACKRLGFNGFSQLKFAVLHDLELLQTKEPRYLDKVRMFIETIEYDGVHRLVQHIDPDTKLVLCGRGGSEIVARYLSRQLIYLGMLSIVITEEEMLDHFNDYKVIMISSSGSVIKVNEIAKVAKQKGMMVMCMTRKESELSFLCDEGFYHGVAIDALDAIGREQQIHMMIMVNDLIEHLQKKFEGS